MIFTGITSLQVNSIHSLFLFLKRLKVIGSVETETARCGSAQMGWREIKYNVYYYGYDPSTKGQISAEDALLELLKESERLKLYDDLDPDI